MGHYKHVIIVYIKIVSNIKTIKQSIKDMKESNDNVHTVYMYVYVKDIFFITLLLREID